MAVQIAADAISNHTSLPKSSEMTAARCDYIEL